MSVNLPVAPAAYDPADQRALRAEITRLFGQSWQSGSDLTLLRGEKLYQSFANGITATTGGTQLNARYNLVNATPAGGAVRLWPAMAGLSQNVQNYGANPLKVLPYGSDTINAVSSFTLPSLASITFDCAVDTHWATDVLTGSGDLTLSGGVGIGIAPQSPNKLTIYSATNPYMTIAGDGVAPWLDLTAYGGASNLWPLLNLQAARGTFAAPTHSLAADWAGAYAFNGYNGTGWSTVSQMAGYVDTWTAANNMSGGLVFHTRSDGVNAPPTERVRIDKNGHTYFTGNLTVTTPAGPDFVAGQFTNTGSTGAVIGLTGNGATTPSKYLRALNGGFQIVNNAYNAAIFAVDDGGNTNCLGQMVANTGVFAGNGRLYIAFDGTFGTLMLDQTHNDYFACDSRNHQLSWNVGTVSQLTVDAIGNVQAVGMLLGLTNPNVGASRAVLGHFVSGTMYNIEQLGIIVGGTQATAYYAAAAQSATWSTTPSDRRLKSNIGKAGDALATVKKIAVHALDFTPRHVETEGFAAPEPEHWPFSLIADEVADVLPHAAMTQDEEDGQHFVGVHPQHLIAVLWKAVQELTARVEKLEAAAG